MDLCKGEESAHQCSPYPSGPSTILLCPNRLWGSQIEWWSQAKATYHDIQKFDIGGGVVPLLPPVIIHSCSVTSHSSKKLYSKRLAPPRGDITEASVTSSHLHSTKEFRSREKFLPLNPFRTPQRKLGTLRSLAGVKSQRLMAAGQVSTTWRKTQGCVPALNPGAGGDAELRGGKCFTSGPSPSGWQPAPLRTDYPIPPLLSPGAHPALPCEVCFPSRE